MSIKAKILAVEPRARHGDTIYSQGVKLRICSGNEIWVYDNKVVCSEKQVGETVLVEISPTFNVPEIKTAEGLSPEIKMAESSSPNDHIYIGEVVDIEVSGTEKHVIEILYLNVGCGNVEFKLRNNPDINIKSGDTISIPVLRSDIQKIIEFS